MVQGRVRFSLLGERCALVEAPAPASLAVQRCIWGMATEFAASGRFSEIVPGMNNLGIVFDPLAQDGEALLIELREAWARAEAREPSARVVEIPVEYGGEAGPDLVEVARQVGLTPREVVERHAGGRYTVFFLGFQPGFAYLGGMPAEIGCPRRASPRITVPPGSIGIGGEQTGIYPGASPGGWQLIGRTALRLFDPTREVPSLLAPGDSVRFLTERIHA